MLISVFLIPSYKTIAFSVFPSVIVKTEKQGFAGDEAHLQVKRSILDLKSKLEFQNASAKHSIYIS